MFVRVQLRAVVIAAACGLSTTACGVSTPDHVPVRATTSTGTGVSRGVSIPRFYSPPVMLPKANGALIRSERLPIARHLPGLRGVLPGRATRVMYKSTDSAGRPVAVTGAYIEPTRAWSGGGPRPLVVVAPGTLGQGDQCAASLGLEHPLTVSGSTLSAGYEDVAVYRLLEKGAAVVVTDYVGLGTTDRLHTYVNRVDEAHAVLDAARSVRGLKTASITSRSPVGLYGYSQGGGATAAAAELQPSYAPDVLLTATYAGAPPADLAQVTRAIDGSDLAGALGWAINGLVQAYPALRPVVSRHTNAAGRAAFADMSTRCVGDAILKYANVHSTAWTTDGRSVGDIVQTEPALQAVFEQQRIGTRRPAGSVRVATGLQDNLVPHAQARAMAVSWCRLGADITYVPIRLPELGRALVNHLVPLITDQGNAISWLIDRVAGKPAGSSCQTISTQP